MQDVHPLGLRGDERLRVGPNVCLGDDGQALEVFACLDGSRVDASLVHDEAVVRHRVVAMPYELAQALVAPCKQLISAPARMRLKLGEHLVEASPKTSLLDAPTHVGKRHVLRKDRESIVDAHQVHFITAPSGISDTIQLR